MQQVAEHVRAANIEVAVASRGYGTERDGLWTAIIDGDLDVVVGVFAGEEGFEGVVDVDEVAARGITRGIYECNE